MQLPITAGDQNVYVLTYTADIIKRQAGGYSNSVRFEGGDLLLGGNKNNNATVSAPASGGGGGGSGVASRKATISIVKTDSETDAPIPGATFTLYQWNGTERGLAVKQEETGKDGKLSFRVKPDKTYLLEESAGAPGYAGAMGWTNLPAGVTTEGDCLLIPAGAAKSELQLKLTNEAKKTDIVFRLFKKTGSPMSGETVQLSMAGPDGKPGTTPVETTVGSDGKVSFSGLRRGAKYLINYPGGTMTVDVPIEDDELPKVILPDGTEVPLTADYDPVNPDGFGGTGGSGGPVDPVEPANPEKLPTELPDPNVPNAPNRITIMKDGTPKTYQKVWDSKTETWAYFQDVVIPLDEADVPQTGGNTWLLAAVTLFSGVALAIMTLYKFLRLKKREKK